MDAKSQLKVIKAGFTILRSDDTHLPTIKYKDAEQTQWATYSKFETKAARDRNLSSLLEKENFIQD